MRIRTTTSFTAFSSLPGFSWLTGLSSLIGVGLLTISARAAVPEILVRTADCPEDAAELQRLLRVELGERVRFGSDGPAAVEFQVSCGPRHAVIVVRRPVGGEWPQAEERWVNLSDTEAKLRPRVLALAVAELVRDREIAPPPEAIEQDTPVEPAPRAPPEEPPELEPVLQTTAFARGQSQRFDGELLYGAGLGVSYVGLPWLALGMDASASRSHREVDLGSVTALVGSFGAHISYRGASGDVGWQLGLGQRFGFARVQGQTSDPELARGASVSGPWGGPFARTSLGWNFRRPWMLELAGEGGYVLWPVSGEVSGDEDVVLDGAWMALMLGIGVAL